MVEFLSALTALFTAIAAVGSAAAAVVGLIMLARQRELHLMVNSRLDQFLTLTATSARAEGKAAERVSAAALETARQTGAAGARQEDAAVKAASDPATKP